ncbi:MAG: SLATT domain-containing protein [Anaerolineaceae bacterium]|nr:SLATT domain-containing protein [Anaerolineaceae bacterium]
MFNKPKPDADLYGPIDLSAFRDREHSKEDFNLLFRIYMEKRVESQVDFYQSRIRENELNSDFTFTAGAFIMTLSSLIATLSAGGALLGLSLIAAILPAIAALLASFRQLYGWDQQITIYRDSKLGLQRARLLAPDDDKVGEVDLIEILPQLVVASEEVFTSEVSQWGQFIAEKEKALAAGDTIAEFKQLFAPTMVDPQGNLRLSDAQLGAIQSILAAAVPTGSGSVEIERETVRQISSSVEVAAVRVEDVHPADEPSSTEAADVSTDAPDDDAEPVG